MSDDILDNLDSVQYGDLQRKVKRLTSLLEEKGYKVEDVDFPHIIRITRLNLIADYSYDYLYSVDVDTVVAQVRGSMSSE